MSDNMRVQVGVVSPINVQIENQKSGKVQSIAYGGQSQQLKTMSDVSVVGAQDGDVLSFVADTNSFVVSPVSVKGLKNIDAGTF